MEEVQPIKVNPLITIDILSKTFDPALLVGLILAKEQKNYILKLKPCQPPESGLFKPRGAKRCAIETGIEAGRILSSYSRVRNKRGGLSKAGVRNFCSK